MQRGPIWLSCCLIAAAAPAHPGDGLEVAADGTVYFADVARETVWRVPLGEEPEPLVEDRWTHSLTLSADGTLYYEREEPEGAVPPCSFWRISPDGEHERIIDPAPTRRDFGGSPFAIDLERNVYYPYSERGEDGGWRARIMRRTPEGVVSEFSGSGSGPLYADGPAGDATIRIITAMASTPDGSIVFADRDRVRQLETTGPEAGRIRTLSGTLIDARPADPPDRRGPSTTVNRLYGLAVTDAGQVLVAYRAGRRVILVGLGGQASVAHRSEENWSPLGVAERDGTIYVLEVHDRSIERLRVLKLEDALPPRVIASLE